MTKHIHSVVFCAVLFVGICSETRAQVGIGTTTPSNNAILDLVSNNKGLLVPRLSTTERDAMGLATADNGMIIYNTSINTFQFWNGAVWANVGGGSYAATNGLTLAGSDIGLGGTLGAATTIDQASNQLNFTNGAIGIGTNSVFGHRLAVNTTGNNGLLLFGNSPYIRFGVSMGTERAGVGMATNAGDIIATSIANDLVLKNLSANGSIVLATGSPTSTERLRILDNGNVGIGTTSPAYPLDLNGDMNFNSTGKLRVNGVAGTTGQVLGINGSGNMEWATPAASGWSLTGNAGIVDGTNFIGTTTDVPLNFRVNNVKSGRIENSSGSNTFFGYESGNINSGTLNSFFGHQSGKQNSTGSGNTAVGNATLFNTTTGSFNAALGAMALASNNANHNVGVGYSALNTNSSGANNVAVGSSSLALNATGSNSTAVGSNSLNKSTAGNNTAVGANAGANITSGQQNTAIGMNTMLISSTALENTAIGDEVLYSLTTGNRNTGAGVHALRATLGNNNTALGWHAGNTNTTGSNNTFLGYDADASVNNLTNATAIGFGSTVSVSNALVLGNNANVGIGTSSPSYKLDVVGDINVGLTDKLRVGGVAGTAGQVLSVNGSGNMEWATPAGGADNLGNHTATTQIQGTAALVGTAAAPSYSFAGNLNTGIYSPNTNIVGIATNGTHRMTIDGFGNVGIGTTTPATLLEVGGGGAGSYLGGYPALARLNTNDGNSFGLIFSNQAAGSAKDWGLWLDDAGNFNFENDPGTGNTTALSLMSTGNAKIYKDLEVSTTSNLIIDGDAGSAGEVLSIDGSGNMVWAAPATGGADDLGNHTMTTTLNTDENWISGDGDSEGMYVDEDGYVYANTGLDLMGNYISNVSNPFDPQDAATKAYVDNAFGGAIANQNLVGQSANFRISGEAGIETSLSIGKSNASFATTPHKLEIFSGNVSNLDNELGTVQVYARTNDGGSAVVGVANDNGEDGGTTWAYGGLGGFEETPYSTVDESDLGAYGWTGNGINSWGGMFGFGGTSLADAEKYIGLAGQGNRAAVFMGGNVGIGTTEPEGLLDSYGDFSILSERQAVMADQGGGLYGFPYGDDKGNLVVSRGHGGSQSGASGSLGYVSSMIDFRGNDGFANEASLGQIISTVDANGGSSWSGSLLFATSPGGGVSTSGRRTTGHTPLVRMMLDHEGRLGIGTNSPFSKLHIASGQNASDRDGGVFVNVNQAATDSRAYLRFSQNGDTFDDKFYIGTNFDNGINEIWGESAWPITFGTDDAERMRISPAGDVGIGLNNPAAKLDVLATTNKAIQGKTSLNANGASGVYGENTAAAASVTELYGVHGKARTNNVYSAGVLGEYGSTTGLGSGVLGYSGSSGAGSAGVFGENAAVSGVVYGVKGKISSATAGSAAIYGEGSSAGLAILGRNNSTAGSAASFSTTNNTATTYILDAQANGTSVMRVRSDGRVGIGTTNPSTIFEVNGNDIAFTASGTGNVTRTISALSSGTLNNNAGDPLVVRAGNAGSLSTGAAGGSLSLWGGNAAGSNPFAGGAVNITGGTGTGVGGQVVVSGGAGGSGATAGNGGAATLQGGNANGNNRNGGNVIINGGAKNGTGVDGDVQIAGTRGRVVVGSNVGASGQPISGLDVQSSLGFNNISFYAGTGNIAANDLVVIYTGAAGTLTLPPANVGRGRMLMIRNAGTGSLTVSRGGTDVIATTNAATANTVALTGAIGSRGQILISDGVSKWYIMND